MNFAQVMEKEVEKGMSEQEVIALKNFLKAIKAYHHTMRKLKRNLFTVQDNFAVMNEIKYERHRG